MVRYELEFHIRSSVSILFNCLSTPGGLSEWFADDVNCNRDVYTFIWNDSEQEAELISGSKNEQRVIIRRQPRYNRSVCIASGRLLC